VIPSLQNVTAGQTGAYPGAQVSFAGANLEAGSAPPTVTINGNPVTILNATSSSITLQLPSSLPTGPAILAVNNGAANSFPVAVSIDPAPPVITSIQGSGGNTIDSLHPAYGGNVVNVYLSGFADQSAVIFPSQVSINVGGVNHPAVEVDPAGSNLFLVRFVLSNLTPTGAQTPITVYLNGRSSYTATIATSNN
jgi:uncharacterized protein (TIGR03437 family)